MNFLLVAIASAISSMMPQQAQEMPQRVEIADHAVKIDNAGSSTSTSLDESPSDSVDASALINFAQTLKGIRYKYASADPKNGFDCSGFVLYVFKHFHINVPRSSAAFARIGRKVLLEDALPGDIILFTGPKTTGKTVGHVGIVTGGGKQLSFIHASSGKSYSVVETMMTPHYMKRFVQVVRVL